MFLSPLKTSKHLMFSDIFSMGGDKSEHCEEIGKQPAYSRTNIICCIVLKIIYMNLQCESSLTVMLRLNAPPPPLFFRGFFNKRPPRIDAPLKIQKI